MEISLEEDLVQLPSGETEAQFGEAQGDAGKENRPPLSTTKCFLPNSLQGGGREEETGAQQGGVPRQ